MVKIFNKYIFWKIFCSFLVVIVSFVAVAWLSQSLRLIEKITEVGAEMGLFFKLSLYMIPSLLWMMLPPSVFIAIIFTFHKLHENSELIVLKASGVSNFGLFKPVLLFIFVVCLFAYFLGMYFLPKSHRNFKDMKADLKQNHKSLILKENHFMQPVKGITILVKSQISDRVLANVFIYDDRDAKQAVNFFAKRAEVVSLGETITLKLIDGNQQILKKLDKVSNSGLLNNSSLPSKMQKNLRTQPKPEQEFSILYFDEYFVNIKNLPEKAKRKRIRKSEERYLPELLNPKELKTGRISKEKHQKFIAEAFNRMFIPLPILIFSMLALLPFFKENFNRQGENFHIFISSIFAVFALGFIIAGSSVGVKNFAYFHYAILTLIAIFLSIKLFKN